MSRGCREILSGAGWQGARSVQKGIGRLKGVGERGEQRRQGRTEEMHHLLKKWNFG